MQEIDKPIEELLRTHVKRIFNEDQAPGYTVYHYTSIAGLLGIINSSNLWLTNINFLNDKSEVAHALDLIKSRTRDCKNKKVATFLNSMADEDNYINNIDIYVASFCGTKELLSQWHMYASGGSGCQIEFDLQDLRRFTCEGSFSPSGLGGVYPVIYENKLKIEIIDSFIADVEKIFSRIKTRNVDDSNYRKLILTCYLFILTAICFFKDPSFKDENEFRIYVFFAKNSNGILWREKNNYLVPYVCAKDVAGGVLPIKGITVGATSDEKLAIKSIQMFTDSKGYKFKVARSGIPLR